MARRRGCPPARPSLLGSERPSGWGSAAGPLPRHGVSIGWVAGRSSFSSNSSDGRRRALLLTDRRAAARSEELRLPSLFWATVQEQRERRLAHRGCSSRAGRARSGKPQSHRRRQCLHPGWRPAVGYCETSSFASENELFALSRYRWYAPLVPQCTGPVYQRPLEWLGAVSAVYTPAYLNSISLLVQTRIATVGTRA